MFGIVQWLGRREYEGAEQPKMQKTKDVEEFIGWFKQRIRESSINEAEKRQLKSWLFGKLTSSALSSDEAERIRKDISDSADS